jgi:hypothetical protein
MRIGRVGHACPVLVEVACAWASAPNTTAIAHEASTGMKDHSDFPAFIVTPLVVFKVSPQMLAVYTDDPAEVIVLSSAGEQCG